MASQTLLWTALPNGTAGSRGRLSVFVSPRLSPDNAVGTLEPFVFLNWPAQLQPGQFRCQLDVDGTPIPTDIVSRPESTSWQALFSKDAMVRQYQTETPPGVYGSYRAATLHQRIKAAYQRVATEPSVHDEMPRLVASAF